MPDAAAPAGNAYDFAFEIVEFGNVNQGSSPHVRCYRCNARQAGCARGAIAVAFSSGQLKERAASRLGFDRKPPREVLAGGGDFHTVGGAGHQRLLRYHYDCGEMRELRLDALGGDWVASLVRGGIEGAGGDRCPVACKRIRLEARRRAAANL